LLVAEQCSSHYFVRPFERYAHPISAEATWLTSAGTCPNDKGLATGTYSIDFTTVHTLPPEWTLADAANVTLGSQGAEFTFAKRYDAPTMWTNFRFFFGRVEFVVKAAPGTGIVSSMVLLSDDLDEIDWEFLGGVTSTVQTNYFGKGYTGTYNRSTTPSVSSPQTTFHTYSLDWSPTSLVWSIDGATVRTLNAADADSNALVGSQYPQTPMKVSLSLWDAGDPDAATKGWGGGVTPIPPPEPYTMYVKSMKIWNTNPAEQYQYTDRSGSYKSIKCIKEPLVSSSSSQPPGQTTKTLSLGSTSVAYTSAAVKSSSSSQPTQSSKSATADSKTSTSSIILSSLGAKASISTAVSLTSSGYGQSSIRSSTSTSSAAGAGQSTTSTWLPTSHASTSTIRSTLTHTATNCSSSAKTVTAMIPAIATMLHNTQTSGTTWGYAYPKGFTTIHPLVTPGANTNTTSVQAHAASVSVSASTWKTSTTCSSRFSTTTQHILGVSSSPSASRSTSTPPTSATSAPTTDSQYSLIYYGPTKSFTIVDTLSAKSLSISPVTKIASSQQVPVSSTSNGAITNTTPSTTTRPTVAAYSVSYFTPSKSFKVIDTFLPFGDVVSNSLTAATRSTPTPFTSTSTPKPEIKALGISSTQAGALSSSASTTSGTAAGGSSAGGGSGGTYSASYFTPGRSFTIVDSFVPFGDVSSNSQAAASRAASASISQITTSSASGSSTAPIPAKTLVAAASSSTSAGPSNMGSSDSAADKDTDSRYTASATMTLSRTNTLTSVDAELSEAVITPAAGFSSSGEEDSTTRITDTVQKAVRATATAIVSSLYGGSDSGMDNDDEGMAISSSGNQIWATSLYIPYPNTTSSSSISSTFLKTTTSPASSTGTGAGVLWPTTSSHMMNGTIPFRGSAPRQPGFGKWAMALVSLAVMLGVAGEV
ncbi:MAG: hypothetical protein Q9181_007989, partial [Wetmoreana brouardii]